MRTLKDKNGLEVRIDIINGDDAYAGMIEGTPWLARKMRVRQGEAYREGRGHYVDGLDGLVRELEWMPRNYEVWAPNERWAARLVTATQWDDAIDKGTHTEWPGRRHALWIRWYQEGGDPLQRLAEIVNGLDFMQYSESESLTLD